MALGLEAYVGQAAGLATSVLWTATSLFFNAAGRRIGPTAVNAFRIALALVLHTLTHRLLRGAWLPDAQSGQIVFLAASGLVGLAIGDQALFTAFVRIGPRTAMLLMTTAPLFAAMFGWIALGEKLAPLGWLGIGMTLGGVAWVLLERPQQAMAGMHAQRWSGVLLSLLAAACQAGGLLLSKQGMGHGWLPPEKHLDPQSATLIRMAFAAVSMVPILAWRSSLLRGPPAADQPQRPGTLATGYALATCGAVVGPFLGVWMSLLASDRAPLGVAQTLCSLPPILILPFAVWLHGERIGLRAVLGAVLAIGGSAVLFLT